MDTVASDIALVCLSELLDELRLESAFATDPFFSSRGILSSNEDRYSHPSVSLHPLKLTQRSVSRSVIYDRRSYLIFASHTDRPAPDTHTMLHYRVRRDSWLAHS